MSLISVQSQSKPLEQQAAELAEKKAPDLPHWAWRRAHDALTFIGACTVVYGVDRLIVYLSHHG